VVVNAEPGDTVNVYEVDGKMVGSAVSNGSELRMSVKGGTTYIVNADGKILKIAM